MAGLSYLNCCRLFYSGTDEENLVDGYTFERSVDHRVFENKVFEITHYTALSR